MFCSLCCFLNGHNSKHKLKYINDESILEKKNEYYEESISEFDKIFEKTKNLKERIEKEINELSEAHNKIKDKMTVEFEKERLDLNQRENRLTNN